MAHDSSDRPAREIKEIEVTSEMVAAGLECLWESNFQLEMEEDIITRIFKCMLARLPAETIKQ